MQIKEYLNKICEQIKYKPVREEISKEIEDHINDIKEDLIKDGANETTAEIKAINQMGNAEEIGRKLNKIHKPKLDWKLLIITFVLICFGFVVSFIKTTSDIAEVNNLNFMTKFILFTLLGIVLGIGVYFSNYKKVQKYSYLLFIISSSIIIYAILFGFLVNGIPYIRIGTRFFSASVIAIPLYIISFAGFLMEKNIKNSIEIKIGNEKFKIKYNIIKLVFLSMISIFLLLMIPSKASAIVLTLSYLILVTVKIILLKENKIKRLLALWGTIFILGIVSLMYITGCNPYQFARIEAVFYPEKYAQSEGWTGINRKLIINSAQTFGEAEDMSNAIYLFDEGDNYAFVSILAHYGWVISLAMVIAVILFSCRLIFNAIQIKDEYGKLLIIGISSMFILESIFNILMNLNLWIEADFNIPFISYGGLNMIVNLVSLGLVLSVYRRKDIYMYEGNVENIEKISKNC